MSISPEHVSQLAQLGVMAGSGILASIVHSLLKRDGWSDTLNNTLAFAYCLGLAALDLFVQHKLDFTNYVAGFLAVYGAAQGWYSLLFVLNAAESKSSTPAPVLPVVEQP